MFAMAEEFREERLACQSKDIRHSRAWCIDGKRFCPLKEQERKELAAIKSCVVPDSSFEGQALNYGRSAAQYCLWLWGRTTKSKQPKSHVSVALDRADRTVAGPGGEPWTGLKFEANSSAVAAARVTYRTHKQGCRQNFLAS